MKCKFCESECIRKGYQKNGVQKFRCVGCNKYQKKSYKYGAYRSGIRSDFRVMVKRGLGIIDMKYLLRISKSTVISWVKKNAKDIFPPKQIAKHQEYEADEFHTIVRKEIKQETYVSYVINKRTKQVINFCVGSRGQIRLGQMLKRVLKSKPRRIYTDGWSSYPCIIPEEIHRIRKYQINRIERNHLTIRTQVKRVSKNFMHQSKSVEMLIAYLKIYFWG